MDNMCLHKYLFGICRADSTHNFCETGRRKRTYFVLSGSVLTVWPFVEEALNKGRPMARTSGSRMQVVRIRTESNQKIVGKCKFWNKNYINAVFRDPCFGGLCKAFSGNFARQMSWNKCWRFFRSQIIKFILSFKFFIIFFFIFF